MFSPLWQRFSSSKGSRRRRNPLPFKSAWTRLHAERLEDRRMMDGDDVDADTEIVGEASQESESIALIASRFQSTAELEAWLIDAAVAQWQHLFGTRTDYPGWNGGGPIVVDGPVFFGGDDDTRVFVANDAALTSAAPASSTNVQVAGVDEADLVETDGEHIYILTGR